MGVDLSITTAVGVILDTDGIEAIRDGFSEDDEDTYYGEGILDWLDKTQDVYLDNIWHGNAGSYYDDEPMTEYIYLSRLTKHFSGYNMPAGILGGADDSVQEGVSTAEHNQLTRIAQLLGTPYPHVRSFTAVLWH